MKNLTTNQHEYHEPFVRYLNLVPKKNISANIESLGFRGRILTISSCWFVWLVANFFLLISCHEPFVSYDMPEGYGSFSVHITDNEGRTIIPDAPAGYAAYTLDFTAASGGQSITVDRTNTTLSSEPVLLVAGTYDLTLSAYLDAGRTKLAAQGILADISITAGANASASVQLKALSEIGSGTFNWNVSITASGVTQAEMTISKGSAPLSGYPLALLNTGTSGGEVSLPSGIYNVNFKLVRPDEEAEWNELLYVYSSLTSEYSKTFDDQYFYRTHYNVTFDHNYDGNSAQQSVLHGGTITAPLPVRNGYNFNGWYTDAAAVNAFNFSEPVYNNITLYAGWIRSTAAITLNVAQIENGDPVFTTPIVITRNGLNGPATFNVSVANAGNYSYFKWEIAGVGLMPSHVVEGASASAFTINGANPNYSTLGGHVLKLTVTRNGILYQVNIPFTIVDTTAPVELNVHGVITGYSDLTAAFTAIGANAGNFIITLRENQTMTAGRTISAANQHITIIGDGAERTINGSTIGATTNMFSISNATASLTLGNNITIRGRIATGAGVVVNITGGTFTMQTGSKITGHTTSATSGAAVQISNTTAGFIMNGGSIEGNNNTTAATTTTAAGGVVVTTGTFTMNGGSITGNTQGTAAQVTDGTAAASDVYHASTTTASFTMSGDAAIGALKLNALNANFVTDVTIAEGWTGSITTLNLRGSVAATATVSEWWDYRLIFNGINTAKINNIGLGDFIGTSDDRRPINSSHFIGASGNDLGRLMINLALAAVTVSENGGAASGYSNLASVFTAIGTRTGNFTVTLLQNLPITAGYTFMTAGQNITITGDNVIRTITHGIPSTATTMFSLNNTNTSLTLGNNITIIGRIAAGTGSIVNMSNGKFVMQTGSRIREHTNSTGAVVNISGGTSVFEMNGGSIENNTTANTTGAPVFVATTNGSFIMNGGSITGNNNTTAASTTTASGGVALTAGTFTMTGGSITGNTQGTAAQVTEGTAAASDVYHAATLANSLTISGNAAIGALKLNRTSATAGANVRIGEAGWNGSINLLNLRGSNAAAETVLTWWTNILIFNNITSGQAVDIALGDFIGSGGAAQSISPCTIGVSGDNLGRLLVPPIMINNETDLLKVGTGATHEGRIWTLAAQYILMNNITLTSPAPGDSNWTRIGGDTSTTGFTGTFDGNGYTITGMTINNNSNNQGMFGYVTLTGVVKNLSLADINITNGGTNIGGIAGQSAGLILNCHVSGIINSTNTIANNENTSSNVGGIVGRNGQAGSGVFTVQGCSANVTITAAGGNVGGIVGSNSQVIRNCYSTGSIISTSTSTTANIGGIVGISNIGNFSNVVIAGCYSSMSITANGGNIGGIIGSSLTGTNLNNNFVLNESITTSASINTIGRISGGTLGTRSNNRAWGNMPVSSGGTYTKAATLAGKDGLDVPAADLKTQNPWTESEFAFGDNDASPWVWQDGKMPRLYWETSGRDWPAYLAD